MNRKNLALHVANALLDTEEGRDIIIIEVETRAENAKTHDQKDYWYSLRRDVLAIGKKEAKP